MEHTKAILIAIRNALIADSTLTAIVPATRIARANQQAKPAYPYISIRVEGARGKNFMQTKTGTIYLYIYAKAESATNGQIGDYLDDIYDLVFNILDGKPTTLSDSNIRIDNIYESFKGGATLEGEIPTLYYVTARYNYIAHSQ